METVTAKQTLRLTCGVALATGIMYGIFALLDRWSSAVLWGGLLGAGAEILNFVLLAVFLKKAMAAGETKGKLILRMSQNARSVLILGVMAAGLLAPCFQAVAVLVPMAAGRLTLLVLRSVEMSRAMKQGPETHEET